MNNICNSIDNLGTLRHDWIINLPVDLFMAPNLLNGKLYHTYYNIVTIDLIFAFKSENCNQGVYCSLNGKNNQKLHYSFFEISFDV